MQHGHHRNGHPRAPPSSTDTDQHHHPHHRGDNNEEDRSIRARLIRFLKLVFIWTTLVIAGSYLIGRFREIDQERDHVERLVGGGTITMSQLKAYDGTDPMKPILISIKGHIFDVTSGRKFYGPGGGYHFFAGRDGTRCLVTGCFDSTSEVCTQDCDSLEGFAEEQIKIVDDWLKFFSEKYKMVATLSREETRNGNNCQQDGIDCHE